MIYEISHRTLYRYSSLVLQSQNLIHMSPRDAVGQIVRNHSLLIDPAPNLRNEGRDAFGNPVVMLDIESPHREFLLHARTTVDIAPISLTDPSASIPWDALDTFLNGTTPEARIEIMQYRAPTPLTDPNLDICDYAKVSFSPGRTILDGAVDLSQRIYDAFIFDRTATDISTPIAEVFRHRRGVCQDFAHLMLASLRSLRIPARYISGYILTKPPLGQPRLQGADASHAWVSVWVGPGGWVALDPTNGLIVSDEHITFAWGRDYDDICPISGVLIGGGEHTVSVAVDVAPLD